MSLLYSNSTPLFSHMHTNTHTHTRTHDVQHRHFLLSHQSMPTHLTILAHRGH
ncbi:hypothetical protein SODALDRAFT_109510 [Sodiomyces alkalinus F11]|uniref:Uncharacterized protein n=1 Tax=Sodiomyces alkalinus (strain CBS 110278 / VKM F-3762 / F11) TaxID=1314773 RepID=A0A3N2Q2L8_SODAK|nr:hypothetical protein SODALDRAFT_109510 [Sodiomyces alkalinus F11]ROT41003.1 hypothetical protein SODALDRAFT_109510 [Sodiomyces alkalinus F11]